jgi:Siphovirus Gp157
MPDRLDPTFVRREIDALAVTHPDVWEDDELRALALESETGFREFLTKVLRRILETKALTDANKIDAADLKKRQERLESRHDSLRSLALNVMLHANERKVELPRATLSVSNGVPSVIFTDEAALPDNVVEIVRKPLRTEIKKLIDQGVTVPGATLSNAEPSLRITK